MPTTRFIAILALTFAFCASAATADDPTGPRWEGAPAVAGARSASDPIGPHWRQHAVRSHAVRRHRKHRHSHRHYGPRQGGAAMDGSSARR